LPRQPSIRVCEVNDNASGRFRESFDYEIENMWTIERPSFLHAEALSFFAILKPLIEIDCERRQRFNRRANKVHPRGQIADVTLERRDAPRSSLRESSDHAI
jgi:hypothetical protein